jgi:hypothetical protein
MRAKARFEKEKTCSEGFLQPRTTKSEKEVRAVYEHEATRSLCA